MGKVVCPYCQAILDKVLVRKTTCVSCKKYIYVRTSPKTRKKVYVTERDARKIDEEWKKDSSVNSQIDFVRRLVGETEFNLEKDRLMVKFRQEPNDSDVSWGVLNHLVIKAKGLQQLQGIYYQMALFLNAEGKNCIKVRQEGERCELENYKREGIKKVKILSSSNSCKECQQQAPKIFTIEEALELKPIPCKSCSYILFSESPPFCRCLYQACLDD